MRRYEICLEPHGLYSVQVTDFYPDLSSHSRALTVTEHCEHFGPQIREASYFTRWGARRAIGRQEVQRRQAERRREVVETLEFP